MATMVDIRDFCKFVLSDVPKAPIDTVKAAIIDALRDFCQRTYLWTRMSDWTDILAGQSTYGFNMPANTDMCGIMYVEYRPDATLAPQEIKATTVDELNATRSNWRNETGLAPSQFISKEPGVIQLIPYPAATEATQADALRVEVAVFPSMTATQAPEFMLNSWGLIIGAGAKVRLMTMPKQPWSGDPSYFLKIYNDGITACRSRVNKSATGRSMSVKIPLTGRR